MNHHPAPLHSREDMPNFVGPRTACRASAIARPLLAGVLFLALTLVAQARWGRPAPDFSNYDVPLYQQMTNRIKAKISARLGPGTNTRDRYFIIPFAYENEGNRPEYSHSFMAVIRVLPDHKQTKLVQGIAKRSYKNREFQAFTISWLPHDFSTNPNLCVFKGFGARIFPTWNQCPVSVGRDFTLEETIKLAVNVGNAVCMWGPYEITKEAFDLGVKRVRLLDGGTIKYRADDRLTLPDRSAINCFHAMSGIYEPFPRGGIFGTGFKMWGINGTARVLLEYTEMSRDRKLLLEPVDEKKDRYGFVYASTPDARRYNPFERSSAYRK